MKFLYQNINELIYDCHKDTIDMIHYLVKNIANVNKGEPINLITRRYQLHKNPKRQEILKLLIDKVQ